MSALLTMTIFVLSSTANGNGSIIPGYTENPGVALFEDKHYEQAAHYFQSHLQKSDSLRELSHAYLAKYAVLRNDGETAVKHIEQSLAIEPNETAELTLAAEAHCTKATQVPMFGALKLGKKCGKYYNAAADDSPRDYQTLQNAIYFHLEAPGIAGGSKKLAKKYLSQLETASEEDARIAKVRVTEVDDSKQAALKLASHYYTAEVKEPRNLYDLAKFYRDRDMPEQALKLFERVLMQHSNRTNDWHVNDAKFQLAELYILKGEKTAQGIAMLKDYLASSKDIYDRHYFWSRLRLARAYKETGNTQQFKAIIQALKEADYSHDEYFAKTFNAEFK